MCDYRKVYFLVSTDFKKTEQKLGKLWNYAKLVGNKITEIENNILCEINEQKYESLFNDKYISSDIIKNIRDFSQNKNLHIMKMYEKYIKILRENERMAIRLFQSKQENYALFIKNIADYYTNDILSDSEFRCIIFKHKIIFEPYLHMLYFVLKYDIVSKNIYFDIFVSNTQFIKSSSIKKKSFIPKMFSEKTIDAYSKNIYDSARETINDINLIVETINKLNAYIYNECGETIEIGDFVTLKVQKNFSDYFSGKIPINDNETKILLSLPDNINLQFYDTYKKVLEKTKFLVKEKKILNNKSYTVISTSIKLLENDIIYEKEGEEDKHSESILINKSYKNHELMYGFKNDDVIFIIRLYQNGNIGSGLPCNRCVRVLHGCGINNVIYSIDKNNYKLINMNEITYTYTTTGNKLLNIDSYLYEDYIVRKRQRIFL
jgi:hypothetical protein